MSAKSDLYRFIKNAILGGTWQDQLGTDHIYTGVTTVQYVNFWNSELTTVSDKDSFPVPAIFFEFTNSPLSTTFARTTLTLDRATTKDEVNFILHFIGAKLRSEERDEDYLDLIDLSDSVYKIINGKSFANCKNIQRIDEIQDINSSVLMDWQSFYKCTLANIGETLDQQEISAGTVEPEIQQITLDPNPHL